MTLVSTWMTCMWFVFRPNTNALWAILLTWLMFASQMEIATWSAPAEMTEGKTEAQNNTTVYQSYDNTKQNTKQILFPPCPVQPLCVEVCPCPSLRNILKRKSHQNLQRKKKIPLTDTFQQREGGGGQTWQLVNEWWSDLLPQISVHALMWKAHFCHSISPDCEHRRRAYSPALTTSHHP